MKEIVDYEKYVGIENYSTSTPPIGGKLKRSIADFVVREISLNGTVLSTFEKDHTNRPFDPNNDHYTHFTLIKRKTDTIQAARILQKYLNIPMDGINWAGNKDNTAITAQRFSIRGNFVEMLKNFNHNDISISNIAPNKSKEIDLGKLWGNHFSINIRKIIQPYEEIEELLKKWYSEIQENGFPNFYGLQRFGQHRPNSHVVGKYIFQGKYKEAVEEFLFAIYPKEYERVANFRRTLDENRDYSWGNRNCPNGLLYEKMIIEKLEKNPDDYKKGLGGLPKSLINLIMSSYQSFLFNKVISYRLNKGNPIHLPIKNDVVGILEEKNGNPSLVRYIYHGGESWLDEHIEKAFEYERAAVLGPIVGHNTKIEKYKAIQSIYDELFEEEDFEINDFKHDLSGVFTFGGTFRPLNRKAVKLNYGQAYVVSQYPKVDPYALNLEFSLTKGTYATVFLRELTKTNILKQEKNKSL